MNRPKMEALKPISSTERLEPNQREPESADELSGRNVLYPIVAILIGHFAVDVLSAIVPSLLGVIEKRFFFNEFTSALLFGTGSIFSGVSQPLFAWLSDRWNTRIFGGLGLLLGAIGIPLIGYVPTSWMVFVMYAAGMAGVGMFHPIAASTLGRITGPRKSQAISWFFVFGMAGGFSGSLLGPFLATGENGRLEALWKLSVPALVIGFVLHLLIRRIQHKSKPPQTAAFPSRATSGKRPTAPPAITPTAEVAETFPSESRTLYDRVSITFLYLASILRFTVNLSLNYLLVRWLQTHVATTHPEWSAEKIADFASPIVGSYYACIMLGMAAGGLSAGSLIKVGSEKKPMILIPILFAPVVASVGYFTPGPMAFAACFLAGAGFASMVPVSISLAQRLMPGHTSLASGLMLGGAWSVASVGPVLSQWLYDQFGLHNAFAAVGCLLAVAGIMAFGLNNKTIKEW